MLIGNEIYSLAKELFPICRSITGNGVRKTLDILKIKCPELNIFEVPSNTPVFDWIVPKEWNINDAYIKDPCGNKILDFNNSNLHIMGYSIPVHKKIKRDKLLQYVYTEPLQPDVIPYITSYYNERFGFCMTESQKLQICKEYEDDTEFEIYINSTLCDGYLTYGEIIIPSTREKPGLPEEIFFSTYICHPSLANNELSGPCLTLYLANWIKKLPQRRYSYRIIFIPETIGAITYLSQNLDVLKQRVKVGFNLTCVGDDRTYSYVESRYGNTLADKVIQNVLRFHYPNYKHYSFLKSASDERRYQSPGIDLPVVSFSRSLYGEYPEYHTSADDLSLISPVGLQGSFDVMTNCIEILENNAIYKTTTLCEPQLGKRGLYPFLSRKWQYDEVYKLKNILSYADGTNDIIDISNILGIRAQEVLPLVELLKVHNLISGRIV
jgi:aminopeptidase-like protein